MAEAKTGLREQWVADDESEVVAEYNEQVDAGSISPTTGMKRSEDSTPPTPRLRHEIEVPETENPLQVMFRLGRTWWNNRLIERNKNYGMDPYVRAKIGRHGISDQTHPVISTRLDPEDVYINPQYDDKHHNELTLTRSLGDKGELIIEVMDQGVERDGFIGACHQHVTPFIEFAETSDEWQPVMFHIFDHQLGENELLDDPADRDAGAVSCLVKWVPHTAGDGKWKTDSADPAMAQGVLKIKVLACTDLRNIAELHISDIASFADTSHFYKTTAVCIIYVLLFAWYYTAMMDWEFLDAVCFVVTSFSTVGYGDHPSPLETTWERFVTTIFIITGMGVLGVTIGTVVNYARVKIDAAKRKGREVLVKEMTGKDDPDDIHKDENGDLKQEVIARLQRKYPGRPIDEHTLQQELGATVIRHFWVDELNKILIALSILVTILLLGTVVFQATESEETFPCNPAKHLGSPGYCQCKRVPKEGANSTSTAEEDTEIACFSIGMRWMDALYFTTVTASTVGYGDLSPQSVSGKIFAIFYIPMVVGLMSKTIMTIALIPADFRQLKLESFVLDQFGDELSAPDFVDLKVAVNLGPEESIRKNDFTLAMLLRLGRIGKYDITRIEQIFERLDKDKNGELTAADLQDLLLLQRQRMARIHPPVLGKMPSHQWNPTSGAVLGPAGGGTHKGGNMGERRKLPPLAEEPETEKGLELET